MQRRQLLASSAVLFAGYALPALAQDDPSAAPEAETAPPEQAQREGFGFENVAEMAADLASKPYVYVDAELIGTFKDLNYDQYRAIRFRRELDPWGGQKNFSVDLLPPGLIFHEPVDLHLVDNGLPSKLEFSTDMFNFDPALFPNGVDPKTLGNMGWSGFRLRAPLNRPDVMDEVAVFQGASYFRAVARDTLYGLSARGLAIGTGSRQGEEFPIFRAFWLHKPKPTDDLVTVNALLDSKSISGAFEFQIRPGAETVIATRVALFPRVEVGNVGIAPLTSMYWFGPSDRAGVDDYRPAVHDSDGLQMINGQEERIWRVLGNPSTLQVSAFVDNNPVAFGLTQRERRFGEYQDAEARYEKRPSAWIVPRGEWGRGTVSLIEIPVENEFNDNIVSFWQPANTMRPGERYEFAYDLGFMALPPDKADIAPVAATRSGVSINAQGARSYLVEYPLPAFGLLDPTAVVQASAGTIQNVHLQRLPEEGILRLGFEYLPGDAALADLSARLNGPEGQISETWILRWTRD